MGRALDRRMQDMGVGVAGYVVIGYGEMGEGGGLWIPQHWKDCNHDLWLGLQSEVTFL